MSQSKESPAGSALVADIDDAWDILDAMKDDASPIIKPRFDVLQRCFMRARDRISELESSGDAAEIGTLLALKSQFAAQQERIDALELELAQLRTPVGSMQVKRCVEALREWARNQNVVHFPVLLTDSADVLERLGRDHDVAQAELTRLRRGHAPDCPAVINGRKCACGKTDAMYTALAAGEQRTGGGE